MQAGAGRIRGVKRVKAEMVLEGRTGVTLHRDEQIRGSYSWSPHCSPASDRRQRRRPDRCHVTTGPQRAWRREEVPRKRRREGRGVPSSHGVMVAGCTFLLHFISRSNAHRRALYHVQEERIRN